MFDNFCTEKQIRGNYREVLYHYLMTKYAEYENPHLIIDQLSTEEYEKVWKVILSEIIEKFLENNS